MKRKHSKCTAAKKENDNQSQKSVMVFENSLFDICHQPPKKMKKKTVEGGSNVFSMFEQSQIQEFKEVGGNVSLPWVKAKYFENVIFFLRVFEIFGCGKSFRFHSQSIKYWFELNLFSFSFNWLQLFRLCLQAFTIMDQNRDGFIDKGDLRDTYAALGEE